MTEPAADAGHDARPDAGPESGPDAIEQLQRAVLTLIGASRVALDALEAVVADRNRLADLAANGRDLVGNVLGAVSGRCSPAEAPSEAEQNLGDPPT